MIPRAHSSKSVNYASRAVVLGVLLLFSLISADFILKKRNSPEDITQRVQNTLQQKEIAAKETLNKFEYNFFRTNVREQPGEGNRLSPTIAKNGLAVQYYINDSLVSWSDNTVEELNISRLNKTSSLQKLRNGWYEVILDKTGNSASVCLILIKHEYSFENEYLENSFQKDFGIEGNISISNRNSGSTVRNVNGNLLFSLDFSAYTPSYDKFSFILTLILILFFLAFFLAWYFSLSVIPGLAKRPCLFLALLVVVTILMRLVQSLCRFPSVLYSTSFFSPLYYSSSVILPSAGDYLLNSLILAGISYLALYKLTAGIRPGISKSGGILIPGISIIFILIIYLLVSLGLDDLVRNSSFSLDLKDISKIGDQSVIGLLILFSQLLSFYFLSRIAGEYISECRPGLKTAFLVISGILVFIIILLYKDLPTALILSILLLAYLARILFFSTRSSSVKPFPGFIFNVTWMAIFAATVLNFSVSAREKEERKLIAVRLATEKNPITEVLYSKLERRLITDSVILGLVRKFTPDKEEVLVKRIKSEFIKDYWNRFTAQITICTPGKMLRIQPRGYVFECTQYFKQVCDRMGEASANPNLYHLDYGTGIETYLAVIQPEEFKTEFDNGEVKIYMEFTAKTPAKDLGYPELLIDRRIMNIPDLGNYSYALYQGNSLVYKSGKFTYPVSIKELLSGKADSGFFESPGMNHYRYQLDKTRSLILSKKDDSFLGLISPASYLFIIFSILAFALNLAFQPEILREFSFITLKNRFQISNVGIIVVSFLILGCLLLYFLIRLNNLKNMDSFSERTMSVMNEMQERYGDKENFRKSDLPVLEEELQRLSGMFYTDVNVYYPYGKLMLSSRPQVFEEGLISDRMNPRAFLDLIKNRQSAFFQDETIGRYNYTSAYFPLYNDKNELLAYINLPFFSHQEDLKREINDFLVAFMNLYIIFILLSVFVSLAISRYLSAPLGILVSRMEGFQLGKRNEKIIWNHKDEIGRLVNEYNRLIDELAFSADQLAKSERESAWREMAKQVAHEIKNPLTPMKLSVQHLMRTWEDNAGDFSTRLQRFTRIMTEQIDSLSAIATEFSDFAKMPLPMNEELDLAEIMTFVIELYSGIENIQISFEKPGFQTRITGDRKQLVRVFTNLLNNAAQAVSSKENGRIIFSIRESGMFYKIDIEDNGNGIPDELAEKIFLPNFTTKTGGAGLGLAIVRGIIRSMGGEVEFSSAKNRTVFTVNIPKHYDKI